MMAAFRSRFLPRAFCFAHRAILEVPRVMMWVGGAENGRLSREVMRLSRSRRFFFRVFSDPSPSMSVTGRDLLTDREREELRTDDGGDGGGGSDLAGKDSRWTGCGPAVKVKTSGAGFDPTLGQANLILTVPGGVEHGGFEGSAESDNDEDDDDGDDGAARPGECQKVSSGASRVPTHWAMRKFLSSHKHRRLGVQPERLGHCGEAGWDQGARQPVGRRTLRILSQRWAEYNSVSETWVGEGIRIGRPLRKGKVTSP